MTYLSVVAAIFIMMWLSTGTFTWAKFMWVFGEGLSKRKTLRARLDYFRVTLGLILGWPAFYFWLAKKTAA